MLRGDTELARVKVDEKCDAEIKQDETTAKPANEKSPENESTYGHTLSKKDKRKRKTPPPPLVFESIADAKKNSIFLHIFNLLGFVFGGLYIQSNNVENGFNVKVALKPHRVMKTGSNLPLSPERPVLQVRDEWRLPSVPSLPVRQLL